MIDRDAQLKLLAREAAEIMNRINALKLPRKDPARMLLEYELTKVRLRIRDMKAIRSAPRRRLIPYAGAEQ